MQNHNETILSLVRVARQLDSAGMYQQSDRIHEIIRIAQIDRQLKKGWGINPLQSMLPGKMPEPEVRASAIDEIITEFIKSGKIPQEFLNLIMRSEKFRRDLILSITGHDILEKLLHTKFSDLTEEFSTFIDDSKENNYKPGDPVGRPNVAQALIDYDISEFVKRSRTRKLELENLKSILANLIEKKDYPRIMGLIKRLDAEFFNSPKLTAIIKELSKDIYYDYPEHRDWTLIRGADMGKFIENVRRFDKVLDYAIKWEDNRLDNLIDIQRNHRKLTDVRKVAMRVIMERLYEQIKSQIAKGSQSNSAGARKNAENVSNFLSDLREAGVPITEHLIDSMPEEYDDIFKFLAKRELAGGKPIKPYLKTTLERVDEAYDRRLDSTVKESLPKGYLRKWIEANEELAKGPETKPGVKPGVKPPVKTNIPPSASEALEELEKSAKENPKANQYPKAPSGSSGSTQEQQQLGKPNITKRTTSPGSRPANNVQRIRFNSPPASGSAITFEELFKLVKNNPDRWEQFNNMNQDPKFKLDTIKKLLKELSDRMSKGNVALRQAVRGLNLSSPYWELALPALEIASMEFGKYLENPSGYIPPHIDLKEVEKFLNPYEAWRELILGYYKKYKTSEAVLAAFKKDNPLVTIQMPNFMMGKLFDQPLSLGYQNSKKFNQLDPEDKENVIFMINNKGALPPSHSNIPNLSPAQVQKMRMMQ
jgi:hypothetical protein